MKSIQERINEIKYPDNHAYELEGLNPTGGLIRRLETLRRVGGTKRFFNTGFRFLDVGCNKGWFSFSAMNSSCEYVEGIDNNEKCIELCNDMKEHMGYKRGIYFRYTTFRDFRPTYRFDRVFIGNAYHYLFRDANGWDWIPKLASIVEDEGLILIEGPIDMSCGDMESCIPPELKPIFNNLEGHMEEYNMFLVGKELTTGYMPGRCVWLFEKRVSRNNTAFPAMDGKILKVNDFQQMDQVRVELASYAPYSNPIDGWIVRGPNANGWTEKRMADLKPFSSCQNEKELFAAHCERNVFLARNGYIDLDGATSNFGTSSGKVVHFDKGGIHPISILCEGLYDTNRGSYFLHLRHSYNTIPESIYEKIAVALRTMDSRIIEKCFEEVKI